MLLCSYKTVQNTAYVKKEFTKDKYVNILNSYPSHSAMTSLRLSAHTLEIGSGTFAGTCREHKIYLLWVMKYPFMLQRVKFLDPKER